MSYKTIFMGTIVISLAVLLTGSIVATEVFQERRIATPLEGDGDTQKTSKDATGTNQEETQGLIVDSDPTDPGIPLNLVLIVKVINEKDLLLEITARLGKHPSFPTALFFDEDVQVEAQLPQALKLHDGSLRWQGDIQGEAIQELRAVVKAVEDMEGAVEVTARGRAAVGGRMDADSERFYLRVQGGRIRMSLDPFTSFEPSTPGKAERKW